MITQVVFVGVNWNRRRLIKWNNDSTDCAIREEPHGFWSGSGCVDQILASS